jgi:hypothetical protein
LHPEKMNIIMNINSKAKGFVCGAVAAATYGMNPLFTLPLYKEGMSVDSVLFYRYGFAVLILGILMKVQGNVTQYTLNGTQVSGLPFLMVFLLIIRDGIFEIADMLVNKRSIDLLVYLEHLLEKVQVDILHFEKRTILTKHSVVDQALYTLQFVFSQFQCILPPEGLLFPFAEHLFQQKLFAAHHFQQLVNRVKCSHV